MEGLILLLLGLIAFLIAGSIIGMVASSKVARQQKEISGIKTSLRHLRAVVSELQDQIERLGRVLRRKTEEGGRDEKAAKTPEDVKAEITGSLVEIDEARVPEDEKPRQEGPEPVCEKPSVGEEKPEDDKEKPLPVGLLDSGRKELPEVTRKKLPKKVSASEATVSEKSLPALEWWKKLEESAGKQWITWVGAVVLFLSIGLFVKYAFDHKWLGPTGRVLLGVLAGLVSGGFGIYFIRRGMRALGQGLVGAGMAMLYVSLYASYGIYHLLPQTAAFGFMLAVTAAGMALAVVCDAVAISFLAVLGGLITPILLKTGKDPRDALFGYVLVLDLGVLGVAFFKKWRLLDILVFAGTWFFFAAWYFQFYTIEAVAPATMWLCLFFLVFLFSPYVYHLRKSTMITAERFFMCVSNAAFAFAFAYAILHGSHKVPLGLLCVGMSASYLFMGALTRMRIPEDVKAVFSFIAISLTFLIVSVPILFDFNVVTVVWAAEAPLLLYLAYKYSYLPARLGALVPLLLAGGRIFTVQWPLHSEPFTPIINEDFGAAIFVAIAGGVFSLIHYLHGAAERPSDDRPAQLLAGLGSAFLALAVLHVEVWKWLEFSGSTASMKWASSFVWVAGAAGFLAFGLAMRSIHSRISGFISLVVAAILLVWSYVAPTEPSSWLFLNGRFLASAAGLAVLFYYAFAYGRPGGRVTDEERGIAQFIYGVVIYIATLLVSVETYKWLDAIEMNYFSRCLQPLIWVVGSFGCLYAGIRLGSLNLRRSGMPMLCLAAILAFYSYCRDPRSDYLLYFNERFISSALILAGSFFYGFALRRCRRDCSAEEASTGVGIYGVSLFFLLLLMSFETSHWLGMKGHNYLSRCLLPVFWSAGSCAYLLSGMFLKSLKMRYANLGALLISVCFIAYGYDHRIDGDYVLYLNGRFVSAFSMVAMAFAYYFVISRLRKRFTSDEYRMAWLVNALSIASLFVLLNIETYQYCVKVISDPERAHWVGQMSLSIVWGVFAIGLLAVGFWRRIRPYRLCALALFGLTSLKLVIVDMAKIKEGYRIISFFVLGILMIGASYLYHRVEQRLKAAEQDKDLPETDDSE